MTFADTYESIVLSPPPGSRGRTVDGDHLVILFITGNPGLVAYYETYLSLLHDLCSRELGERITTHIYSCSLAGFETSKSTPSRFAGKEGEAPYNLDQQVLFIDAAVDDAHADVIQRVGASRGNVRFVLIGHSVGAYIMLEVISRRQARARSGASDKGHVKIIGGIGLTPTVVDLARSPTGRKVGFVASFPILATLVSAFATALVFLLPRAVLLFLVKLATGFPDDAVDTTTRFIESRRGVYQSLHLARHELARMTTDRWDDELWGVGGPSTYPRTKTKLFFLFAGVDHWIADETRVQLIAARASSGHVDEADKPEMEIDQDGVIHAFCIRHSKPVAVKTLAYLQKLVKLHWQA